MTAFETYFPFDTGPGADSGQARWRKMARLWCSSGVVPFVGTELWPQAWDVDRAWVVGTGAMWVNGHFGAVTANKELAIDGSYGLVVGRLYPDRGQVALLWRPGAQPSDVLQDPDGWWDIPLHWLRGDHWEDVRTFTHPKPGLAELPANVPRRGTWRQGPPTGADFDIGAEIMQVHTNFVPGFEVGRHYRVSAGIGPVGLAAAATFVDSCRVDVTAIANSGAGPEVARQRVFGPQWVEPDSGNPANQEKAAGWTSFTLQNVGSNCLVRMTFENTNTGGIHTILRVPTNAAWMEVQDLGR